MGWVDINLISESIVFCLLSLALQLVLELRLKSFALGFALMHNPGPWNH